MQVYKTGRPLFTQNLYSFVSLKTGRNIIQSTKWILKNEYEAEVDIFFFLGHQEVMMSPQDFLRSITPGIPQPEDLGLDNFLTIPVDQVDTVYLGVDEDSIFHQLGSGQSLKCALLPTPKSNKSLNKI